MAKKKQKAPRRTMRLLPITVTMLSLLFIIKVNELYLGSEKLRDMYSVRDAVASEKKADDKKEMAKEGEQAKEGDAKKDEGAATKDAAKPEDKKSEEKKDAKEGEQPKEGAAKPAEGDMVKEGEHAKDVDAKKEESGHGEAKKEEGGHGEAAAKPVEDAKTFGTGKTTVKEIEAMKARDAQPRFTKTEVDLLQNLSKRREELDTREKDLELKSKVLDATDKRINDKISEMKVLEAELSKVIAQYNEKQDVQIKSLVKIYEGMKPDEAAAIFNELEMPILLEVISKMSERKVALVLANMSPKRARDVTQELAEKRKKSPASSAVAPAPKP